MADLSLNENLLPSLLDRLTDDKPTVKDEPREQRVGTVKNLRESVQRDLEWLMNTVSLQAADDLGRWPSLKSSVINFGMPGLSGRTLTPEDLGNLEKLIKTAIQTFEPRILPDSVQVKLLDKPSEEQRPARVFQIEGSLWGTPMPEALYLRTELDLDLGEFKVSEG